VTAAHGHIGSQIPPLRVLQSGPDCRGSSRLALAVARAQLWLAQSPRQFEEYMRVAVVMAVAAAMETRRRFMTAEMKGRVGRTELGPVAGDGLQQRGARRAVADFWGRVTDRVARLSASACLGGR
jgi:hypothetical protein